MRLFRKPFLVLSSLFVLSSCAIPKALQPLEKGEKKIITKKEFSPPFKDNFKSLLFKANLVYGDKFDFGGLLALKQTSPNNYRLIFMAVAGGTLFDFEFGKGGFTIHKTIKGFDKKILLKIIEQDFSLLLAKDVLGSQGKIYLQKEPKVIESKQYKKCYFSVHHKHHKPLVSYKANRVTVTYKKYLLGTPRIIDIEHHNAPLSIHLKLLKR